MIEDTSKFNDFIIFVVFFQDIATLYYRLNKLMKIQKCSVQSPILKNANSFRRITDVGSWTQWPYFLAHIDSCGCRPSHECLVCLLVSVLVILVSPAKWLNILRGRLPWTQDPCLVVAPYGKHD